MTVFPAKFEDTIALQSTVNAYHHIFTLMKYRSLYLEG